MKCTYLLLRTSALLLLGGIGLAGLGETLVSAAEGKVPDTGGKLDPRLQKFFAAKEKHARQLTEALHLSVAPEVWEFFNAGIKEDWDLMEELYRDLRQRSGQYNGTKMDLAVQTPVWQTVNEAYGAFQAFSQMDIKFVDAFSKDLMDSIPAGSVYFGGTDPGRWLITAMCRSHPAADPFYTLTQNAFADGNYLVYLRAMYGKRLMIPSEADAQQAFQDYMKEAGKRLDEGQLKPGETVKKVNGSYSVSGTVTVFSINALLVRNMFDHNPNKEFYIEESQPLEWMYPHLSPNVLILKVNREPVKELSNAMLKTDREFWEKQTKRWIGGWVNEGTSIQEISTFADRIYGTRDLKDFEGDAAFVTADRKYPPQKIYGKLRSAQAAVYAWRAEHATSPTEKERMKRAADFAFRQAFALCPFSSEAVLRYVTFLQQEGRVSEARLLAKTSVNLGSGNAKLQKLAEGE
jgi:hypothetical protein